MKLLSKISAEKTLLVLFTIASGTFFCFFYDNHLYQREQLQMFQLTFSYLIERLSVQGGFAIYFGEFFTQFFGIPLAGAAIISMFLVFLQMATRKLLFTISGNKNLEILSFLPAVGYWILLTQQFYYLSGLIGLLISVLASVFYLGIKRDKRRILSGILLIPLLYWLTGGAFLVFTLNIIIPVLSTGKRSDRSLFSKFSIPLLYILLASLIPVITRNFLITDSLLQSYLSGAYYAISIFFPVPLIVVFLVIPSLILLQSLLPLSDKQSSLLSIVSVILVATINIAGIKLFAGFKEEKEMAYDNLVYDQNWDGVIRLAENEQPASRRSMVAVNLALARTGQLSTKMFRFDQDENSLFLDYERRGMTPFIANEPFYYLGLINFSQMFAMESIESTPDAKIPVRAFKRVAETYYINDQYDVAGRYFYRIGHTLFYNKWAEKFLELNSREAVERRKLKPKDDFFYNGQQMDIALRYLLIANPENRMAYEYLMAHYLLKKDFDGFLKAINMVKSMKYDTLPVVFQEAIAYILTIVPEMPAQLQNLTPDKAVTDRIRDYARLYSEDREDTAGMKKEFGDTYWYYLHFK
ncbi:MAG: DUF6057 family protein [Bacteroidales bacterium]